jgi:hypothetical protein
MEGSVKRAQTRERGPSPAPAKLNITGQCQACADRRTLNWGGKTTGHISINSFTVLYCKIGIDEICINNIDIGNKICLINYIFICLVAVIPNYWYWYANIAKDIHYELSIEKCFVPISGT